MSDFFERCFEKHNFNELNNLDANILYNFSVDFIKYAENLSRARTKLFNMNYLHHDIKISKLDS